tara:strand:+ start:4608 stop:6482 length:1875 start_codon:yes stop_codon:yes gene_type:complete
MCGGGNIIDNILDATVEIAVAATIGYFFPPAGLSAATGALIAGGTTAVAAAFSPSADLPNLTVGADVVNSGRNVTIRQTTAPQRVVYGSIRTGGVFAHTETTGNNEFLHTFVVLACHKTESLVKLHLDDDALVVGSDLTNVFGNDSNSLPRLGVGSGSSYYGTFDPDGSATTESSIRVVYHDGDDNQVADATAVSDISQWTTNHRLRGLTYIYGRFRFLNDIYKNGLPSISAELKGKPLFSVVENGTGYTQNGKDKGRNPALCIRDFLTDTKYGLKVPTSEINDSTTVAGGFGYAETRCEDTINSKPRYLCDGVFETSGTPKSILDRLLASCSGKLIYQNGKFNLYVGFYTAPTVTITEDDIVGEIVMQTKAGRKDVFNGIKAKYHNRDEKFVDTEITPITSTKFKTEDDGEEIFANIQLTMVSETNKANELAAIELLKSRQQISFTVMVSMRQGFKIQAGDFVAVTIERFGFSSKVFECLEWTLISSTNSDMGLACVLSLKETDTTVFDNSVLSDISTAIEATDPATNTTLTATVVAPTNLTLTSPAAGKIKAVWECTTNPSDFIIEYKLTSASTYTTDTKCRGSFRQFTLSHISAGNYDVRVFSRDASAVDSAKISGTVSVS